MLSIVIKCMKGVVIMIAEIISIDPRPSTNASHEQPREYIVDI